MVICPFWWILLLGSGSSDDDGALFIRRSSDFDSRQSLLFHKAFLFTFILSLPPVCQDLQVQSIKEVQNCGCHFYEFSLAKCWHLFELDRKLQHLTSPKFRANPKKETHFRRYSASSWK